MRSRKILIPIAGFSATGGARVLSELANNWIIRGHQVDFLVDHRKSVPYFPTTATIRTYNAAGIIHAGPVRSPVLFAESGNAPSIYIGMYRAISAIGMHYDIIFGNHSLTMPPITFASTGSALKVYYVQAYEPEYYAILGGFKNHLLGLISRASYHLRAHQVANAPLYIDYKGVRAAQWIPPGIDKGIFFRRSKATIKKPGEPLILGTIGRHEPMKGTRYVLDAFTELALRDADIQLKVAFGNLPQGWEHERAEVIVPRNDEELANYYRSVDVLIAPGTGQLGACHYPVIEAMSCGTPVITTGYFPADSSNSWIVPIKNSKAIVSAVEDIRSLPSCDMVRKLNMAALATEQFSWNLVTDKFLEFFESME